MLRQSTALPKLTENHFFVGPKIQFNIIYLSFRYITFSFRFDTEHAHYLLMIRQSDSSNGNGAEHTLFIFSCFIVDDDDDLSNGWNAAGEYVQNDSLRTK